MLAGNGGKNSDETGETGGGGGGGDGDGSQLKRRTDASGLGTGSHAWLAAQQKKGLDVDAVGLMLEGYWGYLWRGVAVGLGVRGLATIGLVAWMLKRM